MITMINNNNNTYNNDDDDYDDCGGSGDDDDNNNTYVAPKSSGTRVQRWNKPESADALINRDAQTVFIRVSGRLRCRFEMQFRTKWCCSA